MGVVVVLETLDGNRVVGLADPRGGTFDSAGDFDRLLADDLDDGYAVWDQIDPYADTRLEAGSLSDLLDDLSVLDSVARDGPERRGLARLRAMAERARTENLVLVFIGD